MSRPHPKMIDLEKDRDDKSSQRQDHDHQKSQGPSLQQEHRDDENDDNKKSQGEKDEKALKDKSMKPTDNDAAMPTGLTFALIMASIFSALFLTSLDKLIISTAIPQITNTFNTQDDIGWYGTAYLITNCSFQIVFGKLYKFLPAKPMFLGSLLLFMVGSALCGAAPNSIAFILGRAIAGLGAGGVVTGIFVILVFTVPLQKRPIYQGYFGVMFGLSSILGPTIGGAFATHVSWRWCFYINLPIGGLVGAIIVFFLHLPNNNNKPGQKMALKDKLWQMNPLGTLSIVSGTVLLCLALHWGGITYAWSNGRVIAVLVLALLLLIAFALVQVWLPEQAILPPHIFVQRSIIAGFWTSICLGSHQTIFLYYIPTWLQAIKGKSAVESGVDLLPMLLPFSALSLLTGYLISRIGYYTPFLILGVCIIAVGAGLLTTLQVNSSTGAWVGYQVLYGVGLGFAGQIPSMAAYAVLAKENVGIGASLMFFGQTLFGAIFVSVGQNVLDQQLIKRLSGTPGVDAATITSTGATNILNNVPLQYHASALQAYNNSLRAVFQVALCLACIGVPGAFAMEWRSVKKGSSKGPHGEKGIATKQGSSENAHNEEEAGGAKCQDDRATTSSAIVDEAKATDGVVHVTNSVAGSVATQTTAVEETKAA